MRKGNGFTLIELLVVIITIEFLLAVLMPAKQKFKKVASEIACRSNLKNVGLAVLIDLSAPATKLQAKKSI